MSPITVRRHAETERNPERRSPRRSWLAIVLICVSAGFAAWLLSRDVEWEARRREARDKGRAAEANGHFQAARTYYEAALANNPYDWETHLFLARILNQRLNDYGDAMRHYLYAMGYSPEPSTAREVGAEIGILKRVRLGELENPVDAIEDMFRAVEASAEEFFSLRMSPRLRDDHTAYWRGWNERGRGKVVFCRIRDGNDGFYDASVELLFPEGTTMAMHLSCVRGEPWRLEVSFP